MQCGIHLPIDALGLNTYPCHRDAIRRCADCGLQLCREHVALCCDEYWCDFCLESHQTTEVHIPKEEVVEV